MHLFLLGRRRIIIDLIGKIRAVRPDILLSGDFIVGFPGESEQDFNDTMALVEAVGFGQAYSFKYSARPGTPAAERSPVDAEIADARLQRLQHLLNAQQSRAQCEMVGKTVSVLFEKPGRLSGQMVGKSEYLHAVHVEGPLLNPGDLRRVRILESAPNSLAGELE